MNKEDYLGKFVRKLEIDYEGARIVCYVRGITVAEFIDLCEQGFIEKAKPTTAQFMAIGISTIVDWKGIKEEPTNEVIRNEVPDGILIEVGKFAYEELTMLSEEEYEKLRGHVHFLHWASKDENERKAENFRCKVCLEKNIAKSRPCGRYTDDEIETLHRKLNDNADSSGEKDKKSASSMLDKYKSEKKFKSKDEAKEYQERHAITGGDKIRINGYTFPECPTSWVDDYVEELGDVLFHCHSHDLSFFGNAVAKEPYKFYKAQKVVSGTISKLRSEEIEEDTNN